MPKRRPSADIDEDVIQLGCGTVIPSGEAGPKKRLPKKNPIGYIWPKTKRKTRKRRT